MCCSSWFHIVASSRCNRKTVNVLLQATAEIHQYLHCEVAVSVFSVGRISTSQVYENLKWEFKKNKVQRHMSPSRRIQPYHFQEDLVGRDGPFKRKVAWDVLTQVFFFLDLVGARMGPRYWGYSHSNFASYSRSSSNFFEDSPLYSRLPRGFKISAVGYIANCESPL